MASPTIQFVAVPELFRKIDTTTGDALVVQNVSEQDCIKIVDQRKKEKRHFRIKRYYSQSRILIITIPTRIHERLHLCLYGRIYSAVEAMGLGFDWGPDGSTTLRPTRGPNRDGGEGDTTAGPASRASSDWPTLVIEAGYTQSMDNLRNDMRWWFSASGHEVKIVLLIKTEANSGHIIIENWHEVPAAQRQGATTTRAAPTLLEPSRSQLITINRGSNSAPPTVLSGPLRLDFELLFLRAAGQGEGDIVVSIANLQRMAQFIWAA
ncbi:hypothetical protein NCS52_00488300 [Fusarium sp. LHS14.1]|nr:hypothetical protein NCS52_00488300 [Fusarium sp. LHS14.1]